MTHSGYVDARGSLALALMHEDGLGIRYAGRTATEDWEAVAAFDVETWSDVQRLSVYGKVMLSAEPHPDHPDTWPDWASKGIPTPTSPKRGIAVGDERFILLRPTHHSAIELWTAVAPSCRASVIVHYDGYSFVLVELGASDPFVAAAEVVAEVVWDRTIVEFRDSRLVSA